MEALRFEHQDGDYQVIVRSEDLSYAWERFKGHIDHDNDPKPDSTIPYEERYCRYASKDTCKLYLYDYQASELKKTAEEGQQVWEEQRPVMFETCEYNIAIRFKPELLDTKSTPKVLHVRKDIETAFFLDKDYNGKVVGLSGNVSFLNEPGVFKLEFEYQHGGKTKRTWVTFEVVSPKLDTKHDYKSLLNDVNEEYNDVIFRYLATTYQQLTKGRVKNDIVWMNIFEDIIDDYLKNIELILRRPHQNVRTYTAYAKVEKVKKWTPALEDEYAENKQSKRLDNHWFELKESDNTVNTRENRFVKHTLTHIGKRLTKILHEVLTNNRNDELSDEHRNRLLNYKERIHKLEHNPFFRTIGRFEGMSQDSMVLQSRAGYQQVYKDWIKLRRGIDLYNGASNIGTLQIWEIYELWCFIKIKRMVKQLLHIEKENPAYEKLVSEPAGSLLNPFSNSRMEHVVTFNYPTPDENDDSDWAEQMRRHAGDIITLHYQHTFNRRNADVFGVHTATTEQRPDIVLNITKEDGSKILLTYLYDAKYRVISDKRLDKDIEKEDIEEMQELHGGDYPPSDAINQMHRYRDAIYYGSELKDQASKEVIGGYILFPGRGDNETIAKRYYSNSVSSVNIGAFPLLPKSKSRKEHFGHEDEDSPQLYEHLKDILLEKSIGYEHVENAIPQRGLVYKLPMEGENAIILVGYCKPEQWKTVLKNKLYYTRAGFESGSLRLVPGFESCKFLVMHNHQDKAIFKLTGQGARIVSGEDLQKKGFSASKDYYLAFDLESSNPEISFEDKAGEILQLKKSANPYKKEPYFTTLGQLLEPKPNEIL